MDALDFLLSFTTAIGFYGMYNLSSQLTQALTDAKAAAQQFMATNPSQSEIDQACQEYQDLKNSLTILNTGTHRALIDEILAILGCN